MVSRAFNWVKTHKLVVFLITVIIYLFFKSQVNTVELLTNSDMFPVTSFSGVKSLSLQGINSREIIPSPNVPSRADIANRKVITNSNYSLLVKNVTETVDKIEGKTVEFSGYVINTNIERAESNETGYVELRVPSSKVSDLTTYLRGLAVKVVSENVSGADITDQYVDIQERINQLQAEKAAFQAFFSKAQNVTDMMKIQESIFQVQDQIDSYKGQLAYMEGASETSRLVISLSTDELGLPYSPAQPWKPENILKQAVRSMLSTLQKLGSLGIWAAVYSPIIVIAYLVYRVIKRKYQVN